MKKITRDMVIEIDDQKAYEKLIKKLRKQGEPVCPALTMDSRHFDVQRRELKAVFGPLIGDKVYWYLSPCTEKQATHKASELVAEEQDFNHWTGIIKWAAEFPGKPSVISTKTGGKYGLVEGSWFNFDHNQATTLNMDDVSRWKKIKPKRKYLKPLHLVLSENEYQLWNHHIYFPNLNGFSLRMTDLGLFNGNIHIPEEYPGWPEEFIEEREV